MKLSGSIMAHPDRALQVNDLVSKLDRPVPVHWDREGPASGNGDRVWRQARAAWSMADPDADWHVLIQDDAVVSADFLAGLEAALEYVPPNAVVSPYLGTGRTVPQRWKHMTQRADEKGVSWIVAGRVMWGVCLVLPVARLPEILTWCDRKARMPDDMRIGAWAVRNDLDVWYPWPSLVDHLPVPSLTKHRASDRRAVRHHTGSALELAWDRGAIMDPMHARRRGPVSGPRGAWRLPSQATARAPER